MALITTPKAANADSYCTVAEADAYHAARGANSEWTSLADVASKERQLKWAARTLDTMFRFIGTRASQGQSRAWPRSNAVDPDGYLLDNTVVPGAILDAHAELAFQLLKEDWTQGTGSVLDEGVQVGPIKTTREQHNPIPASVASLLRGYVVGSTGAGISSIDVVLG